MRLCSILTKRCAVSPWQQFSRVYAVRQLHPEVLVAEAAASFMPTDEGRLHWLALNLTPGLGPTKGRKPVEHFGGIANIFKATLTELEATGI